VPSHLLSWTLHGIADVSVSPGLAPPSRRNLSLAALRQARLFCPCGSFQLFCAGLCVPCYRRHAHSRRCFAGQREAVLDRDGFRCRGCGADRKLVIHHRRPGVHQPRFLITQCAACHARLHRLLALRSWVEPSLVPLWREQHPNAPLQLQFAWDAAR
jgi:hypothetical protein